MTAADIRWNVERLRDEAKAALKHAEALKRYGEKNYQTERCKMTKNKAEACDRFGVKTLFDGQSNQTFSNSD